MKVISMTTIQLVNDVKFSSVREHQGMIAKRNLGRIGLGGGGGERKCPSGVPPAVPGCGHTPLIGRLTPGPWRLASREKGGVEVSGSEVRNLEWVGTGRHLCFAFEVWGLGIQVGC